nr:ATP-binding protein [Streptomyces natalensis]
MRQGAHIRFAKTSRVLADLAGGHADRTWEKRIRELVRPDDLILDDFAMRQLNATQADDLYELVSERQGRSLIITSNRAPSDWYPLFPNPLSPNRSLTDSSTPATRSSRTAPATARTSDPRTPCDRHGPPIPGPIPARAGGRVRNLRRYTPPAGF